jgi:serine/threonine-protein kinase
LRITQTKFAERNGEVSPDGRWLAYDSDESGRAEVYVHPWPAGDGGRWQVSTSGGVQPLWARNGRELFCRAPDGALMTVPVDTAPGRASFASGTPTRLITGDGYDHALGTANNGRTYDVSPDGRRFLLIKVGSADGAPPRNLVVVLNWTEELKRLAPASE